MSELKGIKRDKGFGQIIYAKGLLTIMKFTNCIRKVKGYTSVQAIKNKLS